MVKKITKVNPPFGDIPEQTFSYSIPEEAEIVRQTGDPDSDIYLRKAGRIFTLDPKSFMTPEELDPAFGAAGKFVVESTLRKRGAEWIKQAGVPVGEISLGDTLRELAEEFGYRSPQAAVGGVIGKEQFLARTPTAPLAAITPEVPSDLAAFNQQMVAAQVEPDIYSGLVERDGTIFEKATGRGFKTEAELATSLGIQPHQIEWGKIAKQPITPTPPISPEAPEVITPEGDIAGIRQVLGADWTPSPAFTTALQSKGIYGAIRIQGTNEVYSIGVGGRKETAESFKARFGTDSQKGIVDVISREQAAKLGITDTGQTPVAPSPAILIDGLSKQQPQLEIPDLVTDDGQTATTIAASIEKYIELQKAAKTKEEKEAEEKVSDITTQIEELVEEGKSKGIIQLEEEKKREIEEKQTAVDDADSNLAMKLAEITALTADYYLKNQEIAGRPGFTMASVQGQQRQNYQMFLVQKNVLVAEASMLQATSLGLAGKLNSAIKAANRATDLRWSNYEHRLNSQLTLLDMASKELSGEQKIRVDALNAYYEQLQETLDTQKDLEKAKNTTLLSQMKTYPDAFITLDDTLEIANQKITTQSRIYSEKVRPPQYVTDPTRVVDTRISDTEIEGNLNEIFSNVSVGEGIEKAEEAGHSKSDVKTFLDTNTKMTISSINSALDEVFVGKGGLFDIFTPDTQIGNGIRKARDAGHSRADIKGFLDLETDLNVSSIDSALDEVFGSEKVATLSDENLRDIAIALVKKTTSVFGSKTTNEAKALARQGSITSGGKKIELSPDQVDRIIELIDEIYPGGERSLIRTLLPFGK